MAFTAFADLLETLLAEENVMDVVGALEYDPELAARQNHRQFLREHVIFKEVCPPGITGPSPCNMCSTHHVLKLW